jgi:hypothetical protein
LNKHWIPAFAGTTGVRGEPGGDHQQSQKA